MAIFLCLVVPVTGYLYTYLPRERGEADRIAVCIPAFHAGGDNESKHKRYVRDQNQDDNSSTYEANMNNIRWRPAIESAFRLHLASLFQTGALEVAAHTADGWQWTHGG